LLKSLCYGYWLNYCNIIAKPNNTIIVDITDGGNVRKAALDIFHTTRVNPEDAPKSRN